MNKGCFYWIFIGFWLEPIILVFKIPIVLLSFLFKLIISSKDTEDQIFLDEEGFGGRYCHENKNDQTGKNKIIFEVEKNEMFDREKGIYPSGQYLVGRDIPLGGYILTSRGSNEAYVQLYPSYKKFKTEDDVIIYQGFKGDFHVALMEENTFLVVENADIQKI